MSRVVYDIESYPNVFTLTAVAEVGPFYWQFEISDWKDQSRELMEWLGMLSMLNYEMVGFNNLAFDYNLIHYFMLMHGHCDAAELHRKTVELIYGQDSSRFPAIVYPSDRKIRQLDLFKIHHFDNKAKTTSLKEIEFNMRLDSVEDLPFPPNTYLKREDIPVLLNYNRADVDATKKFYQESHEAIRLREELSHQYGKDFTNHNDVKIGKDILQLRLEADGVSCYDYGSGGRVPRQSVRNGIALKDCIPPFIRFNIPQFEEIKRRIEGSVIFETKGALDDMNTTVNGIEYFFGTGGLHASVSNKEFTGDREHLIIDADVTSMYPSIAITNGYYPEHLGKRFVDLYSDLKNERLTHPKGSPKNAALKLALNGTYGASNDKFSVFYDPLFTMKITIGGQLMLAMLIDMFTTFVPGCQIIQVNTDGVTCRIPRSSLDRYTEVCRRWSDITRLDLEFVEYMTMFIADVNNYLAVSTDGKVKRKGRYEYRTQWHQNASKLVVPKVAEKVLLENKDAVAALISWPDKMDFMCRVKVPRTSRLVGDMTVKLPHLCRYYVAKGGLTLTKIMPPLAKKPGVYRNIGVESGRTVCVCNNIKDATLPIDYEYYANEVRKLTDIF